jgi:phosphotriesterase-related protein
VSDTAHKVQTVLGLIEPAELGRTMTHEHLLLDLAHPDLREAEGEPILLDNCGYFRRHSNVNPNNLRLSSETDAIDEVRRFKTAGGGTIVEASNVGLKRNPHGLRRISVASSVHIVMGSSYYVHDHHPSEVARMSEAELTQAIVRDITEGADDTRVKAGLIGEVGLTWPVHPDEARVLRASAKAQQHTGAPLMVHPGRNPAAPMEAIRILESAGGDPRRTIMAHIDRTLFGQELMRDLARTGCYLEFDLFGQESSYYPLAPIDMPNDAGRIDYLMHLMEAGYRDQLLVSQDICHKTSLVKFGGEGYAHILENVVPIMQRKGMTVGEMDTILLDNPARIMAFA